MPITARLFDPSEQPQGLTVRAIVSSYLHGKRLQAAAGLYAASSLKRAEFYLAAFLLWLGERADGPTSSCRKSDLENWVLSRPEWKSPHTRNDAIGAVVTCFKWAAEEPLIERCPYKRPTKALWPSPQPRAAITESEYQAIMDKAKEKVPHKRPSRHAFRRALFFLWDTGARTCEMRAALWEEIDWTGGILVLGKHKTAKRTARPRVIALSVKLLALLKKMAARCDGTPSGPIFLNGRGSPWTKDTFAKQFRKYAELAKVRPEVTAYCLRHGFCVQGLERGVGERQLADVLGHTSTKYVEWYGRSAAAKAEYLRGINEQVRGKKDAGSDE